MYSFLLSRFYKYWKSTREFHRSAGNQRLYYFIHMVGSRGGGGGGGGGGGQVVRNPSGKSQVDFLKNTGTDPLEKLLGYWAQ